MERYQYLKTIFYKDIENKVTGYYKEKAYFHSIQVSTLCTQMAKEKDLNMELASIIGLFHDIAQFLNQSSFNHALLSANYTQTTMEKSKLFNQTEIQIVYTAIKNHSDKHIIHDNYSELLKDADVLVQYYNEPSRIFTEDYKKRIDNI